MTDLKHDRELPFAVINRGHADIILGRFIDLFTAEQFRKAGEPFREIVDTTPKPKIPEDAEFVTWQMNGANEVAIFADFNPLRPWEWAGVYHSQEELLVEIGDAEVTVLVRKEES